ncbi:MAG: hypothetical protein SWH61_05120 [Thermodesulfobacteriota bacterium]|nr:hypothetical protein [Thermodesulfobacteriota bacterium]
MAKKTSKVSLDATIKSIFKDSGIPTKKDIDRLSAKIDRLETQIKRLSTQKAAARKVSTTRTRKGRNSATNTVLGVIAKSKKGIGMAEVQKKTGFDDKKIRNILFRLHKLGKIKRVGRGEYMDANS